MFKKIAAILMLALANNNVAMASEFDSDTRLTNTELSTGLDLHYRSGAPSWSGPKAVTAPKSCSTPGCGDCCCVCNYHRID